MKTVPAGYRFTVLRGRQAVCRLPPGSPLPRWARGPFVSITRTPDELSIICPAAQVPATIQAERNWRVIKLIGPFPLNAVGVLASVAAPLARAEISLLAVATFETDYILVKAGSLKSAVAVLRRAGHRQV